MCVFVCVYVSVCVCLCLCVCVWVSKIFNFLFVVNVMPCYPVQNFLGVCGNELLYFGRV